MSYINIIVPGAEYVSKESKISGDKAHTAIHKIAYASSLMPLT